MNPAWVKGAAARIEKMERELKALRDLIEAQAVKIEALEVKRGPGRPPKDKTE